MDTMRTMLGLALVLLATKPVWGRTCYDCIAVEVNGQAQIGDFVTDPDDVDGDCVEAGLLSIASLGHETCTGDERCAAAQGTVTTPAGASAVVTKRMCQQHTQDECFYDDSATLALQEGLKSGVVVTRDAELCYCDRDYCSPISCPGSYEKVFGYCLHYGVIAGLVAGLVVALLLVTGCCFCCCCCCKCFKD